MLEPDPVDLLIADEAAEVLEGTRVHRLLLLDAPALLAHAREVADEVVAWCDDLRDRDALPAEVLVEDLDEAITGSDMVWLRLPKGLGALDEYAELVANHADPEVRVVAGGRVKHMTLSMNEVLQAHFGQVSASRGRQKSRVLHARLPYPADPTWPRSKNHADLGITLWAHGATFNAAKVDEGTRLLVEHVREVGHTLVEGSAQQARLEVLDWGCGNGILATLLARRLQSSHVMAADVSSAAVEATTLTAEDNGVAVDVLWRDGLAGFADDSLDVLVTNPPFHIGVRKESGPALEAFGEAARVLRSGGELWCVYNSHLPWRARLNELVGPTTVVQQTPKYTLTRTIAR